jgi:hypothetical protein
MIWTALTICLLLAIPATSFIIARRTLAQRNKRRRSLENELGKLEMYLERQREIEQIRNDDPQRVLTRESERFLETCYSLIAQDDSSTRSGN